jgi:hypothetical protein
MANTQLNYSQIRSLVEQLGKDDIDRLTEYLEKRKLSGRLLAVREKLMNVPLSMEEITVEVDAVREDMNREGRY